MVQGASGGAGFPAFGTPTPCELSNTPARWWCLQGQCTLQASNRIKQAAMLTHNPPAPQADADRAALHRRDLTQVAFRILIKSNVTQYCVARQSVAAWRRRQRDRQPPGRPKVAHHHRPGRADSAFRFCRKPLQQRRRPRRSDVFAFRGPVSGRRRRWWRWVLHNLRLLRFRVFMLQWIQIIM